MSHARLHTIYNIILIWEYYMSDVYIGTFIHKNTRYCKLRRYQAEICKNAFKVAAYIGRVNCCYNINV